MKDKLLESIRSRWNLLEDVTDDIMDLIKDPIDFNYDIEDDDDETDETDEEVLETLEATSKTLSSVLYHGSHLDRSKEISKVKKLLVSPEFKTSGGLITEGGLIWFTDSLEKAKDWASSSIDIISSLGKTRSMGEVFAYKPSKPLKFAERNHKLTSDEAYHINDFFKIPDYKQLKAGDGLNLIEWRFRSFETPLKTYQVKHENSGEDTMFVIYPPLLRDLGFDGIYDSSGYALAADKDIIVDTVRIL